MRSSDIIKLMMGSFYLTANGNLSQEGFGPEFFAIIKDFKFSLVKMFAIGCKKTDKAFGAGFQN